MGSIKKSQLKFANMKRRLFIFLLCVGLSLGQSVALAEVSAIPVVEEWWVPSTDDSLYMQLQGAISVPAWSTIVDVDLFATTPQQINVWHSQGKKVVCYFSAGSYENWRSDARLFPQASLGKDLDDWQGERWIDVRSDIVKLIMQVRILTAVVKGCDGIDPDNIDGFSNDTGFPLTYQDSRNFNLFIARQAHLWGLAIGLKNGMDMLPDVATSFDFAINEQCNEYDECETYRDFVKLDKPVFNLEYQAAYRQNTRGSFTSLCLESKKIGIASYVYPLKLDGSFVIPCK